MYFIYVVKLTPHYMLAANWTEETNTVFKQHWDYLVGLSNNDVLKMVGRTDYSLENPENHGLTLFKAESLEGAQQIANNDPCVVNGIMTVTVHPFRLSIFNKEVLV